MAQGDFFPGAPKFIGQNVPWIIKVEEPAVNTMDFGEDLTNAVLTYIVPGNELTAAIAAFTDYSRPEPKDPNDRNHNIQLTRKIGHRHPQCPWLIGTRCYVQGEIHDKKEMGGVLGARESYVNYYVVVGYEVKPYPIIIDIDVPKARIDVDPQPQPPNGGGEIDPDAPPGPGQFDYRDESKRYTFDIFEPAVEILNVDGLTTFDFKDTGKPVPGKIQIPIGGGVLKQTWYRVHPYYLFDEFGKPNSLDKALNTVNLHSYLNRNPSQLRMAGYKLKPRFPGSLDPVAVLGLPRGYPPILYDVELDMQYRRAGFNTTADASGRVREIVYTAVDPPDELNGQPPLPATDFLSMFLSPRDLNVPRFGPRSATLAINFRHYKKGRPDPLLERLLDEHSDAVKDYERDLANGRR